MSQSAASLAWRPTPSQPKLSAVLHPVPSTAPPDISGVLTDAAMTALDILSADAAVVLLSDGHEPALRVAAHAGDDIEAAASLGTRVDSRLAHEALRDCRAVCSVNVNADDPAALGPAATGVTSVLVVPVPHAGGVLAVGSRSERYFGDADAAVLGLVADRAAITMENARLQSDQRHAARELERQSATRLRVGDAHERLVHTALHGDGVQDVVDTLSELVDAPLVLTNPVGARIAAAPSDAGLEPAWTACRSQPGFARALAHTREGIAPGMIAEPTVEWRIRPIWAGGEALGVLVVLDGSQLSTTDIAILEDGEAVLAAELLRRRSVLDVEVRLHGGVLEALMGAGGSDTVETRAALLGLDLEAPQCVVALARDEPGAPDLPTAMAAGQRACARVGFRGVFAQVDRSIVALLVSGDRRVSREVVEAWTEAFNAELANRGAAVPGAMGVSAVPIKPGLLHDGVAAAQQALRVGAMCPGAGPTFLQDVELLAVFADSMKREELKAYVDHCIGELLAYDARTNSELVRTLEVYLDHSCVARHAAAVLFLHPHSLRYRLRRIEEVQGLDLQNPSSRLTAHLATKVRPLIDGCGAGAS